MPASVKMLAQLAAKQQATATGAKSQRQQQPTVIGALAKWASDQLYYQIEVLQCDKDARKCQVQFEDGHKCWMEAKDVHLQLDLDLVPDEQIVCCICDDGNSKSPNEIILCDTCQQGYHVKCHQPTINRETINFEDEETEWFCATCQYLSALPNADDTPLPTKPKRQSQTKPAKPRTSSGAKETKKVGAKTRTTSLKVRSPAKPKNPPKAKLATMTPIAIPEPSAQIIVPACSTPDSTSAPISSTPKVNVSMDSAEAKLETMNDELITVANTLAEKEFNIATTDTKDFVETITNTAQKPRVKTKAALKSTSLPKRIHTDTGAKKVAKPAAPAY